MASQPSSDIELSAIVVPSSTDVFDKNAEHPDTPNQGSYRKTTQGSSKQLEIKYSKVASSTTYSTVYDTDTPPRARRTSYQRSIIHKNYCGNTENEDYEDGRMGENCRMGENERRCMFWCGCIVVGIGLLLTIILLPLSFAGLEYYEMGFVQSKSSGTVDTRTVYMGGLHFIGVNSKFKKFPSSTHNLQLTRATVFNKEKLQISLSGLIGYTLRPEDLKLLHDKYNLGYEPIIQNTVLAAIKTAATAFTVDEYRRNRAKVSKGLFDAVHEALGGKCCRKDCYKYRCQQNCKRYNLCRDSDKGHFADVSYLYLQMVDLSYAQEQRYLRQVIEKEKQDTEKFKQQEKVVRKKTQQNRKEKENQASEVLANAKAKAYILTANARANAKSVTEDARNSGLQILYSNLNVTKEIHKKSVDYIRVLKDHYTANFYINFKSLVAMP